MPEEVKMILSLQGCMAAGKTTAAKYLQKHAPYVHISYEDNTDVIAKIRQRHLDKNKYEDYLEIQKLWLAKEVIRYNKAKNSSCCIMDFGAEEIEFYTLNYPISIGQNWEVETALHHELEEVRKCMPARILFLDASDKVLIKHKNSDKTRSREFFEHYLTYLLPLKRRWFLGKENVDLLYVDDLCTEEVGKQVKEWVDNCMLRT